MYKETPTLAHCFQHPKTLYTNQHNDFHLLTYNLLMACVAVSSQPIMPPMSACPMCTEDIMLLSSRLQKVP